VLLAAALVAVGCGDAADSASANGTPTLGFMTWRDPTGLYDKIVKRCNERADGKWRVKQLPMGPTTDAAREQLTRRLGAGDSTIDMINLDVIWTAEFSAAGWIIDMTKRIEPIKDQYIKAAVDSVTYKNKMWALPVGMNSALLYYRSDIIKTPPTTWEEVAKDVKQYKPQHPGMDGLIFQGAPYEGGTVDALEFLYGAGTEILSPDGTKAVVTDGDGAVHAFTYLRDALKDRLSPKAVKTYVEEDTRLAFQNGKALFMRNWPYAYANMNSDKASKVRGKFKVVALPGFAGHDSASVIGGQNYGITASSKHPELAWDAIACMGDEQAQIEKAAVKGELPVLDALYTNAEVKKALPFIGESHKALLTARNRPVSPFYNDITTVINKAYNEVLAGNLSPKDAAKRVNHGVQKAVDGEAEI
jgi:multiple sugar transport system substrate-binding protein